MWEQIIQNPENGIWLGTAVVCGGAWLVGTFIALLSGKVF